MPPEIKTEAELEALLNNKDKMAEYVKSFAKDQMGVDLEALKQVKRPAMDDDTAASMTRAIREITTGKLPRGYHARGVPGKATDDGGFENFGEFASLINYWHIQQKGTDDRLKILGEGSGDQGGFLVPEAYRAELLMLAIEGAIIRPRATVLPMPLPIMGFPSIGDTSHATNVYGGVQGYWTEEGGTITVSEPTFEKVRLEAKKLTARTVVGNELLQDAAIALEPTLQVLFGNALTWFEEEAFFNGNGGGEPIGLLNADCLVAVGKETGQAANTIVVENLDKMYSRMLPTSLSRAVWFAHNDTFPQLAALSRSVGTGGSAVWAGNIAGAPASSIYGRPVIFTEHCQTLGIAGDIYFVDPFYYLIGDRMSMQWTSSPHVNFNTDETVYKIIQRLDAQPWLRSAVTPKHGTNTLSPMVNLAVRA